MLYSLARAMQVSPMRRSPPKATIEDLSCPILPAPNEAKSPAPAVVVQFVSGMWLAQRLGLPFSVFWVRSALLLFFLVGACWLPVLWLQLRMRDLAVAAVSVQKPLPPAYHRAMRWWFWLGWPAFASVIAIFWLMVFKPV